jgi:hypothetical protein
LIDEEEICIEDDGDDVGDDEGIEAGANVVSYSRSILLVASFSSFCW